MIICKNCGAELPDGAKFCTKCGYAIIPDEEIPREPVEAQAADDWNVQAQQADASYNPYPAAPQVQDPQYQPQYQPQQPQYYGGYQDNAYRDTSAVDEAAKNNEGKGPMIMAIIGLVICGVPGIILCAIAKSKVKAWEEKYGPATGMAKAAKIMGTLGLVFSIISVVCWAIVFIVGMANGNSFFDILEDLSYDIFDF